MHVFAFHGHYLNLRNVNSAKQMFQDAPNA